MCVHGEWILFSGGGSIRSVLRHVTRDVITNFTANNFFLIETPKISIFLSSGTREFINTMLVF